MSKATFVTSDASDRDHHDSDQSEHTKSLKCDSVDHEGPRHYDDCGIKQVEAIHQEGATRGESFQRNLDEKDCQEDEVNSFQHFWIDREELRHGEVEQNENGVEPNGQQGQTFDILVL